MTRRHQRWFIFLIVLPLAYVGLRVSKQLRQDGSSLWPLATGVVALLIVGTAVAFTFLRANPKEREQSEDRPQDGDE